MDEGGGIFYCHLQWGCGDGLYCGVNNLGDNACVPCEHGTCDDGKCAFIPSKQIPCKCPQSSGRGITCP